MKNLFQILTVILAFSSAAICQNTFTLSSNDLGGQATINEEFNGFGCTGKNQSPQLSWKNAPEGTKSFAITMYDPDAPTGSGWWHWLVFDIPSDITELVSGAGNPSLQLIPQGAIQSITDYGNKGYGGPCPPEGHGIHQYIITVYALKTDYLGLDENTNAAVVGYYLWSNTLAKASIITHYKRSK
ncbi:YbhB/YbcL family Raf kinase inhibitor-like protein [Flammeovirga agarivorans]|uniref:YbhB/YbcL family Raf kinase inhibitor-like protein n=1 Tax=Flammeovirga agarivorans TaxID=2726742 RepID=A0A7X8SP46_9BACT|nr:YbhB/YbcL family Raf kinase inhibitor-like protein [Flammeovirga agarivorans]NLR93774.1 YbhB/YbcL family Raf kinase inhibitor-like protein [Flammeovirga agarivorans]